MDVNKWFLGLPPERQAILWEDKWMLANAAAQAATELEREACARVRGVGRPTQQRRIVCAAVRYPCGVMLTGPRHFDSVMLSQYRKFFAGASPDNPAPGEEQSVQGFLDQNGVFMDRFEALGVAMTAGQILEKTHPVDRLFSEDMY